ncbi:response regulator [Thiocystis violacea]|uniref:response regulator n=1 Tax=Thiocystis violacea TaxID=13725 RepID=UPI001907F0E6|nr:response regulator transcription factor [Thiocystis violacea]MBK1718695.1 hypothetical protein [Thiocystis violacea]
MTVTLIVCDDHALVREGLALLLSQQADWQVLAQVGQGAEAVRLATELRPDVVVMDVAMPVMSGIDAASAIRAFSPRTRIVALSMYSDAHYLRRMREAGALAYVLKNEASADLVEAIQTVLRGGTYVSPSLASFPPERHGPVNRDPSLLSERELAVLRLMAEGKRTKEIGTALGISAKTVETYRARLMQKLEIDNLAGLVRFALEAGLLPLH